MHHKTHLYLMVGLAAGSIFLFSSGNAGGWLFYVWFGICAVMMFVMMRGMGGQHRGRMDSDTPEGSRDIPPRNARVDKHR
ncbi:hypothetical protein BH09ACT8_BH09ACT8_66230 [soil metagenome]